MDTLLTSVTTLDLAGFFTSVLGLFGGLFEAILALLTGFIPA